MCRLGSKGGGNMPLKIGQQYKKADFGIMGIEKRWSEITVGGELYTFFSMVSEYNDINEEDGFVYEGRGSYALIPNGVKADLHRHVFVKKEEGSYYTYLGRGKYEMRYDGMRNKIFW
jgi:hypothetical protein